MRENPRTWAAVCITITVMVLCWLPRAWLGPENEIKLIPHSDKIVHFGMFFVFAFGWGYAVSPSGLSLKTSALIFLGVVGLAIGTELGQGISFIDRDPDLLDASADITGGTFGLVAYALAMFYGRSELSGRAEA